MILPTTEPTTESKLCDPRDWRTAAVAAVAAGLLYLALGQTTLYHNDGHRILELLASGEMDFGRHHLSLPVMSTFHHWVGAPLGFPAHRSVTTLNGLNSAIAVGLVFVCARVLLFSRREAIAACLLFAGTFPVLFFATIVEFHGVFLPWVTLILLLACCWIRRGGFAWPVAMGALAGFATQLHSMGIFSSTLCILLHWAARPDRPVQRRLAESAAGIATHAVVFLIGTEVWRRLGWSVGSALDALPRGFDLLKAIANTMPLTAWRELLRPFAPLSLITACALFHPKVRRSAAALWIASLPYLALSGLILGISEHGAYLAALAAPMSLLAVRACSLTFATRIAALTLCINVVIAWTYDTEAERYERFVAGLERAAGGEPVMVLYCEDPIPGVDPFVDELAAIRIHAPTTPSMRLESYASLPVDQVSILAGAMAAELAASESGSRLFMGQASYDCLRTQYESGPVTLDGLKMVFRFEEIDIDGFKGFALEPR